MDEWYIISIIVQNSFSFSKYLRIFSAVEIIINIIFHEITLKIFYLNKRFAFASFHPPLIMVIINEMYCRNPISLWKKKNLLCAFPDGTYSHRIMFFNNHQTRMLIVNRILAAKSLHSLFFFFLSPLNTFILNFTL